MCLILTMEMGFVVVPLQYCFGVKRRMFLAQFNLNGSGSSTSVPSSAFLGNSLKKVGSKINHQRILAKNFKVAAEYDEQKQTSKDKWQGLAYDTSDDQQDITRGKGMVDTLFQAPVGSGTHYAVMSSYDYIGQGLRT